MSAENTRESVETRIRNEQIRLLYKQSPVLFVGIIALTIATSWLLWGEVSQVKLIVWCVANVVLTIARVALVTAYNRANTSTRQDVVWARLSTVMSGASGVIWGSLAIWALQPESPSDMVFIVTILVSMTAASLVALAPWLQAYFSYAISSLSLLAIGLFIAGGTTFLLLGILILFFLFVNSFFAIIMHRNILETLRLRFENIELIRSLKKQKELAEQANRDKSRFLAAASHDLRQPLHALDLFVGSLTNLATSDEQRSLLGSVQLSTRALGDLLNALLDVSRLDAGAVQPMVSSFPIALLLRNVAAEYSSRAQENGLQLRVRASDLIVRSDSTLLGRMLRNLASNAVRYTRTGGVLIGCRKRGNKLRIEVWDTGIGIAGAERDNIFSEFFQLGNKERDRSKGLGLGLAIVKRLSSLLDHSISLRSRPGRGSCFRVDVPIAAETSHSFELDHSGAPAADIAGTFILVIEDDKTILEGMRSLLRGWHCEVLLSRDASSAIREFRRSKHPTPDIIISDFRLAGAKNGIDSIGEIRTHFGETIPAIIVTGDTATGVGGLVEKADCGILFKPVAPKLLRAAIAGKAQR